ncbi:MAG: ABC transporter permease [Firmicutes bacterium]|nr:ABC transporter permease [Bacillota bacterium]
MNINIRQLWEERAGVFVPLITIWIVVAVLILLYYGVDTTLFTEPQLGNTALALTPYVFVAFAQAIVMLTAGIDLSIGASISLITCLMATHHSGTAVVLSVFAGIAIGLWNGTFVVFLRMPAIVVTLANSFVISGVALLVLPTPGGQVGNAILNAGSSVFLFLPISLWSWIVILLAWAYFKRTRTGLAIYALGNNPEAARSAGINVSAVRLTAWAISGFFTALGGIALAIETSTGDPTVGVPFTLSSIAGAVVGGVSFFGGRGTLRGALAGGIIIGALTNVLFFLGISQFVQYIVEGFVLIGALALGQIKVGRRDRV